MNDTTAVLALLALLLVVVSLMLVIVSVELHRARRRLLQAQLDLLQREKLMQFMTPLAATQLAHNVSMSDAASAIPTDSLRGLRLFASPISNETEPF